MAIDEIREIETRNGCSGFYQADKSGIITSKVFFSSSCGTACRPVFYSNVTTKQLAT